jgi:hypothetical protein
MPDDLIKNEYGFLVTDDPDQPHVHDWGSHPLARFNAVKGYRGPVEEWVCSCGVRRVVPRGAGPNAPICDPRDVAYDWFLDVNERSLYQGTGQMGPSNPAMWLTEQQEKSNG